MPGNPLFTCCFDWSLTVTLTGLGPGGVGPNNGGKTVSNRQPSNRPNFQAPVVKHPLGPTAPMLLIGVVHWW